MARDYYRSPTTGIKKPVYTCEVCGAYGCYTKDADPMHGVHGTWRCREHVWKDFLPRTEEPYLPPTLD